VRYHGDLADDGVASSVRRVDTMTAVWASPALDGQI